MKQLFFVFLLGVCCFSWQASRAQQITSVSAIIKGYNGEVVDFEFMNQDGINQQFPYQDGQEMTFDVKLKDVTLMKLNAWIWIWLRPGDQLHADIQYDGRNYKTAHFTGTPEMVKANEVVRDMRNLRISRRYKMNTLAAIVVQIPMLEYYEATQKELTDELALLEAKKAEIPAEVYAYIHAEHEALLLSNLIRCPWIYAQALGHTNVVYPEGYWNILDNYKLTEERYGLKSQAYMAFLLTYKGYMRKKAAHDQGMEYVPNKTIQAEYEDIASFYEGVLRENALFVFLYNQIAGGGDMKELGVLVKNYQKNYTKNKEFRKILSDIMQ